MIISSINSLKKSVLLKCLRLLELLFILILKKWANCVNEC